MPEPYPPEYDEEPPTDGIMEYNIAVGVCYTCEEKVGPDHSEDVGQDFHLNHEGHDVEIISQWTATDIIPEFFFDMEE